MMEIGSEYYIDLTKLHVHKDNIYNYLRGYHVFFADYGRTITRLLYRHITEAAKKDVPILVPSYTCESVLQAFPMNKTCFYELDENFEPDISFVGNMIATGEYDGGLLYLMHYFGKLVSEDKLEFLEKKCKEHNIIIIEDVTHSLFTKVRTIGNYCIASLRKWMAIPEGAVIYSKEELPDDWNELERTSVSAKIEAMILKSLFLGKSSYCRELANVDQIHETYRTIFTEAENQIDEYKACFKISDLSSFLLKCEDVSKIVTARKENYTYLKQRLQAEGICLVNSIEDEDAVPFVALLLLDGEQERNCFRKYLMEQRIYCPVHWPINGGQQLQCRNVQKWATQIISLPIDQRYTVKDMEYMAEKIIQYFKG